LERFTQPTPGKFRGERGENVSPALALIENNRSAAEFIGDVLLDTYGPLKGTNKHIARAANGNERSAEGWVQKRVCPDVPHFLRLAMRTPALNAAVMRLMQHGMNSPEMQRQMNLLARFIESEPEAGDRA
jgi:hypothetical protein